MYWDMVEDVMMRPLEWGVADCCTCACDLFHRVHGIDPMQDIRGTYWDERSALRAIAGGLIAMAARQAVRFDLTACGAVPGAFGVSGQGGFARGYGLVFCPEPGVWVGKSDDGYIAGLTAERSWTWGL